jgi:hypothetical protein
MEFKPFFIFKIRVDRHLPDNKYFKSFIKIKLSAMEKAWYSATKLKTSVTIPSLTDPVPRTAVLFFDTPHYEEKYIGSV